MATKFCTTIKLAPPDRAKADRLATAIGCSTSDLLRAALHEVGDADVPRLRARVHALHESTEEARRAAAARRRRLVLQEVAASPDGVTYADLTAATGFAQGSLKALLDDL